MAQIFPGSNNINLLHPYGNFGSRNMGGKDSSSSRYLYTRLETITQKLFLKEDFPIFKYKNKLTIYFPILPLILINGSTNKIMPYNPLEICDNFINKLKGGNFFEMDPWFRGFKGKITKIKNMLYKISGVYSIINDNTVRITEIPIKGRFCTIDNYTNFLHNLIEKDYNKLLKITSACYNNKIQFDIIFKDNELQKIIKEGGEEQLEKYLKLTSTISTNNMWLYSSKNTIKKYKTVVEIMDEFFKYRLSLYSVKKQYSLELLKNQYNNKVKEYEEYKNKSEIELWLKELQEFRNFYLEWILKN
jgi:DNA topoisomerase-2